MTRILAISLCIISAVLCITIMIAVHRGNTIEKQDRRISELQYNVASLETAVSEYKKTIDVYAKAEKETKEFEKELNDDTTDNLDVVPADYILKQLRAD